MSMSNEKYTDTWQNSQKSKNQTLVGVRNVNTF